MVKIYCPKCSSKSFIKRGWIKRLKNTKPIRQYQCKDCKRRFTYNVLKPDYRQRKPELNKKIMTLYCEGNTLRGMARILKVSYQTVVQKWRFMAHLARESHLKALDNKKIVTKYIQFDEMQTFEHTHKKPLGIQLSVRPKTGEILSAKVCRVPIGSLTLSKEKIRAYNSKVNRKQALSDMLIETSKALDEGYSVLSCDGNKEAIRLSKIMCPESLIKTHVNDYAGMWRLNHTCAKLRHHISRLKRKTWATTKDKRFLQMHLDLFIAWQNEYEIAS